MQYEQLDHAKYETRFLRLIKRPDTRSTRMSFELVTKSISNAPLYSAISYCWGDVRHSDEIEVNGETVAVAQNLADALYHCNSPEGSLLWADAICINQNDLHEKSNQVRLMAQIYSCADVVVVWLGNEDTFTGLASELLLTLQYVIDNDAYQEHPKRRHKSRSVAGQGEKLQTPRCSRKQLSDALKMQEDAPQALHGILELLSRPYWGRIWIVQEIAKARKLSMRCGKFEIDLDTLFSASSILDEVPSRTRILLSAIASFRAQEERSARGVTRMTLLQALIASRHSVATDRRDKVYALLGLTSDGSDLVPFPTYIENVEIVFQRLSEAFVNTQRHMSILLLSKRSPLSRKYSNVAPWAVDWADIATTTPQWLTEKEIDQKLIESSYESYIDLDRRQLHTQGRLLAVIQESQGVGCITPSSESSMFHVSALKATGLSSRDEAVIHRLRSDILKRLSPGNATAIGLEGAALSDALSRMIRDAHKGYTLESYDFDRIQGILRSLGDLLIDFNPVWEWARRYNKSAAKRHCQNLEVERAATTSTKPKLMSPPEGTETDDVGKEQPVGKRALPSLSTFRVMEHLIAGLDQYPEYKLRFGTIEGGHILLTCNDARPEDKIYEIDRCHLPVILRQQPNHSFVFVGEACIARHRNGNWISAKESVLPESNANESKFEPLTIDLENQAKKRSVNDWMGTESFGMHSFGDGPIPKRKRH